MDAEADIQQVTRYFLYQNDCGTGNPDTLHLPPPAPGRSLSAYYPQLRISPSGRPMVAFLLSEGNRIREGYYIPDRTRLIFAEKRDGRWVQELVDER